MAPNMSQEAIAPVHVGDLVELDKERRYGVPDSDGGIAYVTAVNEDGTVNVRYTIKRSESFNVLPERIHSASLAVSARCRSPDEATRPSLLSPHHSPMGWNSLEGRRQQRGRSKHYKPIADVLSENRSWNYHCSEENPLMAYLRDERKKNDKGWLRLRERENAGLPAVALNKQLETTEKTMVVNIMSAFDGVRVPEGSHNDIEKGGVACKISLTRAGRMVKAQKDSYKRVYRDNGTYYYPKIPENKLRSKGEMYFQSMEITGSSEGTAANPKFSLLKHWKETELPALDTAAQKMQTTTGKRVVIRYQWDGARPHVDGKLTEYIRDEFDKRGWILIPQPANSPLTNAKDAALFPAMSKDVTAEQGLMNGSYVLEGEQLWQYIKRVWETMKLTTIARTYAGHHQIVNAIVKCKGKDDFAKDHKGLHCGIRKMYVPYYESENQEQPSGVEVFESCDPVHQA